MNAIATQNAILDARRASVLLSVYRSEPVDECAAFRALVRSGLVRIGWIAGGTVRPCVTETGRVAVLDVLRSGLAR